MRADPLAAAVGLGDGGGGLLVGEVGVLGALGAGDLLAGHGQLDLVDTQVDELAQTAQFFSPDSLSDRFLDSVCLIGPIARCRERLAAFIDAGNISTSSLPSFDNLRFGAGIGARYRTRFGPIRVDVATPLNPQSGDPRIVVYVSLGQAF